MTTRVGVVVFPAPRPSAAGHTGDALLPAPYAGNVVLEAGHLNQSVKLADLAEAYLNGQVDAGGCFVPVA